MIPEIRKLADRHSAALIILLRRNHLALALSSYRHFALTREERANYKPHTEVMNDDEWLKQLRATAQSYNNLLQYALEVGQDTLILFYEELHAAPTETWESIQNFLRLPKYEIPQLRDIHQKASTKSALESMNQAQVNRLKRNSAFGGWTAELTDVNFFTTEGEWLREFKSLCSRAKATQHKLRWNRYECVDGGVQDIDGN